MSQAMINLILVATWQTIYMVIVSIVLGAFFGIPLGVILFASRTAGIWPKPLLNKILSLLLNAARSLPFIILLVAIIPFTRFIVGTSIGTNAAIVPLVVGIIPFIGRIVENALDEIPAGLVEAAIAMGATPLQIMCKFLLPESLPGIINGLTITVTAIVSYSAMAGAVGGGGLGDVAISYGYQRFDVTIILVTILILIVMVQLLQMLGEYFSKLFNKR